MDITRQNILQDALERFIFRGLQDLTGLVWTTLEKVIGGGAGIRTLGTLRYAGFQDQCIQPLCHPSAGGRNLTRFARTVNWLFGQVRGNCAAAV